MKGTASTCAFCVTALISCASPPQPPARAPSQKAAVVETAADPKSPSQSVIRIASDIREACGIDDTQARFEFDSAQVRSVDYPVLRTLVDCFVKGALARRQMRLVGHADPRGDEDYNLVLASHRADRVKQFLTEKGLPETQAATTSRGEMDAKGTDEPTWARDRRVDILLAN